MHEHYGSSIEYVKDGSEWRRKGGDDTERQNFPDSDLIHQNPQDTCAARVQR